MRSVSATAPDSSTTSTVPMPFSVTSNGSR